jgi:outer membrane receptor protein involved in Fe transport
MSVVLAAGVMPISAALAQGTASPADGTPADETLADEGEGTGASRPQGTIVVTAQRRQQLLEDVPLAIQAFTGEQLEETGFRDLRDVIALIPGASEGRGNSAGIRSFQIRGVSSFLGDSTVGYYLDEAAYVIPNRNYAPVARSFDLDRVEVLRGPQGTLYGLGAMGGTIRFITNDPDLDTFGVRGDIGISDTAEGGDMNYYGDIALNAPIVEGKLAIRAVASYEERGGFAASPSFPDILNSNQLENYRVKLLAKPTEELTLKLAYHRNITIDNLGQNFLTTDPASFARLSDRARSKQIVDIYTGYISYDAGPVLLESSTGYVDRTDAAVSALLLPPAAPICRPSCTLDVSSESESFVQEIRAVSQLDSPLDFVIGGIYQEARNLEDIDVREVPPGISAASEYDSTSWAVFGEVSYGFLDGKLRPLVGLRYFEDERDFFTQNRPPFGPLPPLLETQGNFDALNPRFNLTFEPNEDILIYGNVARGFRSGTFNNAAALADPLADRTVQPDAIWSYEIGGKFNVTDNLYLELIGYIFDWSDIQLTLTLAQGPAAGVSAIRNGGEVEGKGIDWTINWQPIPGLTLQNTGNYNSTQFTSIRNAELFAQAPNIQVGRQLVNTPEFTSNTAVTYVGPSGFRDSDILVNATYSYISEQGDFTDPLGRRGDDHHLLRARAGLQFDNFGVYVFGENLLGDNDPILVAFSGISRYYPRVVGLELSFDFQ